MQKDIKNILVPVNFSKTSLNALETAISMCQRHEATLHIVNVFESETLMTFAGMQVHNAELATENDTANQMSLEELAVQIKKEHNIDCRYYSETGFAPYVICSKAEELQCDLIVAGTANTSGLRKFLPGSNVMTILRNASMPVLTIPSKRRVVNFKNILYPIRAAHSALDKYTSTASIIKKNNANVLLMGVVNEQEVDKFNSVKAMVDQAAEEMADDKISVAYRLYYGKNIADEVINTGTEKGVDLVVINTTFKQRLKQFFLPGYANRILNNSFIPVLSIKSGTN